MKNIFDGIEDIIIRHYMDGAMECLSFWHNMSEFARICIFGDVVVGITFNSEKIKNREEIAGFLRPLFQDVGNIRHKKAFRYFLYVIKKIKWEEAEEC